MAVKLCIVIQNSQTRIILVTHSFIHPSIHSGSLCIPLFHNKAHTSLLFPEKSFLHSHLFKSTWSEVWLSISNLSHTAGANVNVLHHFCNVKPIFTFWLRSLVFPHCQSESSLYYFSLMMTLKSQKVKANGFQEIYLAGIEKEKSLCYKNTCQSVVGLVRPFLMFW